MTDADHPVAQSSECNDLAAWHRNLGAVRPDCYAKSQGSILHLIFAPEIHNAINRLNLVRKF
jgi:hypothetical protein